VAPHAYPAPFAPGKEVVRFTADRVEVGEPILLFCSSRNFILLVEDPLELFRPNPPDVGGPQVAFDVREVGVDEEEDFAVMVFELDRTIRPKDSRVINKIPSTTLQKIAPRIVQGSTEPKAVVIELPPPLVFFGVVREHYNPM